MNHEDHKRTMLKTATWRVLASLDTFLISWLITGNVLAGLSIASLEIVTKLALYYFHERAWSHVDWGLLPFIRKNK